mgnify:FL=1
MDLETKDLMKLIEQVGNLKDIMEKKDELSMMLSRFETAEGNLRRFGSMDELISRLKQIEEQIFVCKHFMNTDEAAKYLCINKRTLLNAAQRNDIPYYNPPSKFYYFERDDLDAWVASFRIPSRKEVDTNKTGAL